jgi:hypothetical protein
LDALPAVNSPAGIVASRRQIHRATIRAVASLHQLVVDCRTPSELARFWAAALDDFEVRAYDEAEITRLGNLGLTPETDPWVIVDGPHLELCFQQVDVEPRNKTPLHLDISAPDREHEVERLVALGATVKQRYSDHIWMQDPEGNDFCVIDAAERPLGP